MATFFAAVSTRAATRKRVSSSSDLALEIDYAKCKRFGFGYRELPASYVQPICSGRTPLCGEVLNDTLVSYPSAGRKFINPAKKRYEILNYQTEDERFKKDLVIETNKSTIEVLESVQKKLSKMPPEEAKRFRLDNSLGGRSQVLHQRAIREVYGAEAGDIIDGLKGNPLVNVPLVLERMKAKDEEWREAQKGSNRLWRKQDAKYYWESLDHHGLFFKQNDVKAIRSNALIKRIKALYDERHEMLKEGVAPVPSGPHMEIVYPDDRAVFYDVSDLLIHHVKRQSMQKEEKSKIKKILKVILPDLFGLDAVELSDDEDGGDDDTDERGPNEGEFVFQREQKRTNGGGIRSKAPVKVEVNRPSINPPPSQVANGNISKSFVRRVESHGKSSCGYSLMLFPNPWYVFLRLHQLLCERLAKLRGYAMELISEQRSLVNSKEEMSGAEALRCRPKAPCSPSEFYPKLLQLIKNVLDGQIDNVQYEDSLKKMFTIHSYWAYTMDRMVRTMVEQLQAMLNEELCVKSMALYEKWRVSGGAGGLAYDSVNKGASEKAYRWEAKQLMVKQNCFKSYFFKDKCRITFELVDLNLDSDESQNTEEDSSQPTAPNIELVKEQQSDEPSTSGVTVAHSNDGKGRSAFMNLCKDVFADRSISKPVPCYVCGNHLRLYHEKHRRWRTAEIVEHAITHMEPLFTCRICERGETSKRLMRSHLNKVHPGAKITDYDDLSAANEDKIKDSIRSCFQEGAPKLQATSAHIAMRSTNHIQGHIAGSELKVKRHLHANQLVKDAALKAGFLLCRVCSKELNTIEPALALKHAVGHLKKPLYQCRDCPTTFFTTAVKMTDHVRKLHEGDAGCYIDQSDQFHAEIMAMTEACFGDEYAKLDEKKFKFDAEDPDGMDKLIESIKLVVPLLSESVPSTKFLTLLIEEVVLFLPAIRGENPQNTRLEFLRLMADLSTYCGDLQKPMAKMDTVENALMRHLPVPPPESDSQPEIGAAGDSDEPKMQFSEIECLIYTLHQLGRRFPQHLSSAKKNENLKELRKRFLYLARITPIDSTKSKTPKMAFKSDANRIKQVALKTTSNISVLLKDLLREPPSYKATVDLSWKATEQKSAVG